MTYKNNYISIFTGFLFVLFLFETSGCSIPVKEPDQPAVEENTSRRPNKAFVEKALKKPLEIRVKEYLEVAKKAETSKIHGVSLLVKELIAQRDFQGLDLLEQKLDDLYAKEAVWWAARQSQKKEADTLLRKWALAHPDQPRILRYHPNAPELLIRIFEDPNEDALKRAMCAFVISDMGLVDLLPRLRKFVDDKTHVPMDNYMWKWTLGGAVKECVQHLEVLSRKPEERKPVELLKSGEGNTYYYQVWIYKDNPVKFAVGDKIIVYGKGIESAGKHGSGGTFKFGAWQEKEVDANHVVFEATCEATVKIPFLVFTITAPDNKEGKVKWEFHGKYAGNCSGEVYGPASTGK